ncbi:MAG: aminotransferase class V-fold PLP-dependent enzyme, partial [Planctomycetes bacterium]|nr:aminotransferase class V-fold PLP-dependent enzyme [Planctomycetota bacterium]
DKEIIFTSSGTEANNLALKGLAFAQKSPGKHLVVAATEHHSILNPARALTTLGFEITVLPVDRFGHVRLQELEEALRPDTLLVSIAYANNEIGTVQPLAELIKLTHQKDALFHTDAVAAVGQILIDVGDLGVDLLSLAGNALYGPQGTGALFVRQGVRLAPLLHGGIQERGLRSGTENVAGLVGLGVAASLATA